MLSREAILEYQQIYKEIYGKEISFEKASEGGEKLLRLFKLIYIPIPKGWIKRKYEK